MIRKWIKKLLAPIVREVIAEEMHKAIQDTLQISLAPSRQIGETPQI